MATYRINSQQADFVPKYEFEADRYAEDGAYTKFYDASDAEVKAFRTDTVFDIEII
ncbi:hypothetical protein [Tsukamurella pseudospumae]|uniref:hypothetical protein n=1 Tax=Tsukamurella pseudospumae TaxID=239498 RepID=UPI000B1798A0|nr:hypothetical protein [Tsukamurella pseudospumae]